MWGTSGPGSSGIDMDKLCAIAYALYIRDDGALNIILFVFTNYFLFHSEKLKRENIFEIVTVLWCMHSLKLDYTTYVSGEYAFSCRATHIFFFQYSVTKIIYWTHFIRNKILFPIFLVICSFFFVLFHTEDEDTIVLRNIWPNDTTSRHRIPKIFICSLCVISILLYRFHYAGDMIGLWSPVLSVHHNASNFQNYFHLQALSNSSLNDRVLKAAKYGWIVCPLFLRTPETGQTQRQQQRYRSHTPSWLWIY